MTYFAFREGSHSSVSLIWRSFNRKKRRFEPATRKRQYK